MLQVGEIAPEIRASTSEGKEFVLSAQDALCTVIYFFPKAFTPGCTVEAKLFRDNFPEITLAGASLVGVSTDKLDTQCKFAKEMRTPFPLIADDSKTIAKGFGVLFPLIGLARRITYVLAPDRRVLAVFRHPFRVNKHRDSVLKFVHEYIESVRTRPS